MSKNKYAWGTTDEKRALDYMASDEKRGRGLKRPTLIEKKRKLKAWLVTATSRRWDKAVDVEKCTHHARLLLAGLEK